ncbi:unnamed protein product, partial [Medioppia subpectinata]
TIFTSNTQKQILDRHLVVNQQISSTQLETQFDTIHTVKGILKVAKGQVQFVLLAFKKAGAIDPQFSCIHIFFKTIYDYT